MRPAATLGILLLSEPNNAIQILLTGHEWGFEMSFDEAISWASRDESFKATVYAMNTLLIHKGIYSKEEFEQLFTEWVRKEKRRQRKTA